MENEEDFLRRINDDRDNDFPRLAYADWLGENGRPDYAACIRLQCQMEDPQTTEEKRREVRQELQRLFRDSGGSWLQPHTNIPCRLDPPNWAEQGKRQGPYLLLERGLPKTIRITVRELLDKLHLLETYPIDTIHLEQWRETSTTRSDDMERLFASPALSRITTLHAQNNHGVEFGSAIAETIAANARMPQLTTIDLACHFIGNVGFSELFRAPQYTLQNVKLRLNGLTEGILDVLDAIDDDRVSRLQHLDVSSNHLPFRTIMHLLQYFQGRSLRLLDVSYNETNAHENREIQAQAAYTNITAVGLGTFTGNGSFTRRTGTLRLEG